MSLRHKFQGLGFRTKIAFVLAIVLAPTFSIVTLIQNRVTREILEEELRQSAISAAKSLAGDIQNERMLERLEPSLAIENRIQELVVYQPQILRMDYISAGMLGAPSPRLIASNIEDSATPVFASSVVGPKLIITKIEAQREELTNYFEVFAPVFPRPKSYVRLSQPVGMVRVWVSLASVESISKTYWRVTALITLLSGCILFVALSFALRRLIDSEQRLVRAEKTNVELYTRIQDVQHQMVRLEKLAAMGQVTAQFAHEIGTPLNAMSGHLYLLKRDLTRETASLSPGLSRISIVESQVERVAGIVRDFLKNTRNSQKIHTNVSVSDSLSNTLALLQPILRKEKVRARLEVDPSIRDVRMIPFELEQVLINIINNSIDGLKSVPPGRRELTIRAHCSATNQSTVLIEVLDTGCGIAKEYLPQVLEPFFSTKKSGEGTGLGLPICQQILQKSGGKLWIESERYKFTRVSIEVPV